MDDTGAKGIPHRRERPENTIRKSYAKSGLDASRLIITHEPHTTHPLALYMGSTAKSQSELTHGRSKKLRSARDELLAYIPAAGDSGADRKNIDLIRRLGLSPTAEEDTVRLVDVVKALRRRSDVAADELNLFRCLEGLAVMVTKHHNDAEYREALEGWSKHDIERVHIYHCLNYVLLRLDEGWRGLHLLVLVFLLRAGIRRLQTYLARARRPAALLLLLSGLGDPEFIAQRRDWMRKLLLEAMPMDTLALQRVTPLGMLQDRVKHIVRLSHTGPRYRTPNPGRDHACGSAKVDARQNRKRGIASTAGDDEASSPTKRRRLDLLDGESDEIDNERAKITELARTDFPATAESDGTDCSRFRYYGALASTSVSYDRWSRSERCRLTAISGEHRHIFRLISLTWEWTVGLPRGSSGEDIAPPCDVADSVLMVGEPSPECAIGGSIPIGTDSAATTSRDVDSNMADLCESPHGLGTGCTADVSSCDLSCSSIDASEDTGGLDVREREVGDPVPTSGIDSAAGMLICEAGDTTEAV
ncbi:hypothetical protein LTR54_017622 [Friedmanniomyces endolithicus]|nr:hypothetical protein LTR54_017622 [Friedmanniomyces endolithicus]